MTGLYWRYAANDLGAIVGAVVVSLLTWYLQRNWTRDRTAAEVVELRREVAAIHEQFANFKQSVEIQEGGVGVVREV